MPANHTATQYAVSAFNAATGCWERFDIGPIRHDIERDLSAASLTADDFGGVKGETYLVELLNADSEVVDSVEVVAE